MADEADEAHTVCKRPGTGARGSQAGAPTVIDEAQRRLRMERAAAISLMRTLYSAAKEGDAGRVFAALEAGADPNKGMDDGFTPLMTASEAGHANVVKVLTAHPACDVDCKNVYGQTALSFAAQNGRFSVAQALVGMWCSSCKTAQHLGVFSTAEQAKPIGSLRYCARCCSDSSSGSRSRSGSGSGGGGGGASSVRGHSAVLLQAPEPLSRDEHVLADMGFDVAVCRFAWKASGGRLEVALENLLDGRSAAGYERAKAKQQKQEAAALAKEMANEAAAATAAAAAVRAGRVLSFADPLTICAGSTAGELARAAGHRRLADMLADVAAGRQLEMVMTALHMHVGGAASGTYDSVESRLRALYPSCGIAPPPERVDEEVDFGDFDDLGDARACIVCMDAVADTAIKPCFHAQFCEGCAAQCPTCPTCRVRSQGIQKIYM